MCVWRTEVSLLWLEHRREKSGLKSDLKGRQVLNQAVLETILCISSMLRWKGFSLERGLLFQGHWDKCHEDVLVYHWEICLPLVGLPGYSLSLIVGVICGSQSEMKWNLSLKASFAFWVKRKELATKVECEKEKILFLILLLLCWSWSYKLLYGNISVFLYCLLNYKSV